MSSSACVPLIDPVCLVGGTITNGVLSALASGIRDGVKWIVTGSADWWVRIPSPSLAADPAVTQLQHWLLPITTAVAVLSMIIAGGKMTLTRKASPLADVGSGLLIVAATTAIGTLLPTLLLRAGDAWSSWVLNAATGGQFAARLNALMQLPGSPAAIVVVLGTVAIILGAVQAILMLIRQASLIVLAGVLPLAAAGTLNSATRAWFRKTTSWMLALIFYKPAAAAVYATAFTLIGDGNSVQAVLMGFAMMVLSLVALPVLMKFFTWTTGAVAESARGGGFLQTAMGGVIAVGALRAYSGAGGPSAADQARLVAGQLGPAAAPSGAAPPGGQATVSAAAQPPPAQGAGPAGAAPAPGPGPGASGTSATATSATAAAGAAGAGTAGASAAGVAAGPAGAAATGLAAGARNAAETAAGAMRPPAEEDDPW